MEQAKKITSRINNKDLKNRRDLTGWTIFTIDGETAKDFDDAISLDVTDIGFRLGVHIADVSHYVKKQQQHHAPLNKATLAKYKYPVKNISGGNTDHPAETEVRMTVEL